MKIIIRFYALFLVLFLSACQSQEVDQEIPPAPLSQEKAVPLLVEIHIAEAAVKSNKLKKDSLLNYSLEELYTFVFEKHGMNQESFDELMDYYHQYPEVYETVYEEVTQKLETQLKTIK